MATTTTTLTPQPDFFPFAGLGEIDISTVPRAIVSFSIIAGVITAGGAGNEQRLVINTILPVNFAYVVTDFFLRISADDVADWNSEGELQITDSSSTARTFFAPQEIQSLGVADLTAGGVRLYCPCGPLLSNLLRPIPGEDPPRANIILTNNVQDGSAGTCHLYMRYLQYDVRQVHNVYVNTPQVVR